MKFNETDVSYTPENNWTYENTYSLFQLTTFKKWDFKSNLERKIEVLSARLIQYDQLDISISSGLCHSKKKLLHVLTMGWELFWRSLFVFIFMKLALSLEYTNI